MVKYFLMYFLMMPWKSKIQYILERFLALKIINAVIKLKLVNFRHISTFFLIRKSLKLETCLFYEENVRGI